MEIVIRQIEPGDNLSGLSLGDQKYVGLKIFLQRHAKIYQNAFLGVTYAAFDKNTNKVCAYITILCAEVLTKSEQIIEAGIEYRYPSYPAIKIARLAVDTGCREQKIGRQLVDLVLGIANECICPNVGCRFVMVDSKKGAVNFYKKCGFTLLDTKTNKRRASPVMFVDLSRV